MKSDNISILCREATVKDIEGVVSVHIQAFDGFFLSILGPRFLRVMYTSFLAEPGNVFVVCGSADEITGFAVGGVTGVGGDRKTALRYFPQLFLAVIPSLLKNPQLVFGRLFKRFFDIGDKPEIPSNTVMLRSIGVTPSVKGGGVASILLTRFEMASQAKGVDSVVLTTDKNDNDRAIRFYSKNGYSVLSEFLQDGKRAMYLMQKKIRGGA